MHFRKVLGHRSPTQCRVQSYAAVFNSSRALLLMQVIMSETRLPNVQVRLRVAWWRLSGRACILRDSIPSVFMLSSSLIAV